MGIRWEIAEWIMKLGFWCLRRWDGGKKSNIWFKLFCFLDDIEDRVRGEWRSRY